MASGGARKAYGKSKVDETKAGEIKETATDLRGMYGGRNALFDEIDQAYLMNWSPAKSDPDAKTIQDPTPRNVIEGVVRLLSMTEPIFQMKASGLAGFERVDDLEQSCSRAWQQSGRAAGAPLLRDISRSMALYGQFDARVQLTSDIKKRAQASWGKSKAAMNSIDKMVARSPWHYTIMPPRAGFWQRGPFGLTHYTSMIDTTVGWVQSEWGELAADLGGKRSQSIKYYTYFDQDYYMCWTDAKILWMEQHDMPRLPIVVQQADATSLFFKPEENTQPFLYALLKSGLIDMSNIMMTVFFSMVKNIGLTPLFKHTAPDDKPNKRMDGFNFDNVPAVVELEQGELFDPLITKGLLPPEVQAAMQMVQQKSQESTIFQQALGAPPTGTMSFSAMSLINQSGRLPLSGPQTGGSWGIAQLIEIGLDLLKDAGGSFDSNGITINTGEIPEVLDIECKLDVDLPQDKLQLANIGVLLKTNGLADDEWIQTHILNEPNAREMRRKIWSQRNLDLLQQTMSQGMIQQLIQQIQKSQQGAGVTPTGPGGAPAGAPGQGATPGPQELTAGPQSPLGQQGMQGGLPQTQAGMLPGQGLGNVPEPQGGNGQGPYGG